MFSAPGFLRRVFSRADNAARDSRCRMVVENAPVGIVLSAPDGRLLEVNPAFQRLIGFSAEELKARSLLDLTHPEEREKTVKWLQGKSQEADSTVEMELRYLRGDGQIIWGRTTATRRAIPGSRSLLCLWVVQDITEARSVQEALKEKEARAQTLIGSIDEIVFELDAQGTYVNIWTANDALLVRPRAQLLGRRVSDVLPEEVTRSFFQVLPGVLEGGQPATIEYPLDLPDGRHWFLARINPLPRAAGRPVTVCFLARDITERKRIEESLERSDRMKTEFISTAAHELRTPLTTLIGFTELLLQPRFNEFLSSEEKSEFLREIYAKGRQLTRIVEDLLDLSRLETGQTLPLRRQPIDLGALLEKEVRSFQGRFPSHRLELVMADRCPSQLLVDAGRLEQVVENLLDNAIKFSPGGGRITLTGRGVEEGYLLALRDEGRGLTPEQRERVFDKFYRADVSNTAAPGLGLGMCISRQIVEAHGGRIWVESEPGHGTTVFFTLPLTSPE